MDLTIAVLTYEGEHLLPECLQSISRQDPQGMEWELLVLDNGSTEPVPGFLHTDRQRVVRVSPNRGNVAGINHCFQEAHGDWVLFVANDVRLDPDCVTNLWKYRASLTQPILYQPNGAIDNTGLAWHWPGYGRRIRRYEPEGAVLQSRPSFAATCFLLQRSVWQELGGFDETLGISHEDIDFALRLRAHGYGSFVNTEASALHLMGQTIGRVTRRDLSPAYRRARRGVLDRHYRGLDWAARRLAVGLVDGLAARVPRR